MHRFRWLPSILVLTAGVVGACGEETKNNAPVDVEPTSTSGSTDAGTGPGTGDTTGLDGTTGGTGPADPCAALDCGSNGTCDAGADGSDPKCVCDEGYVPEGDVGPCVLDEACIKLRLLEDGCRQRVDGFPAVAAFFAVDFCSGDAVLPTKIEELGLQFQVLENGVDIEENVESSATIIPKDVESYVVLAVDVSDSVARSQDLPALTTELRGLVQALTPGDDAAVYVSLVLFGRSVKTFVDFTSDLSVVDAALEQLVTDLQGGQNPINPMGTSLFRAVDVGLKELDAIRKLRNAATAGGVLTTGTLVVVTDGKDTSGDTLQASPGTNQVISIGTSADADVEELDAIGRDGSFHVPDPNDWPGAFDIVTTRVDEYPDRSYLLAYCSSALVGNPTVEVTLEKPDDPGFVPPTMTAQCAFDAALFAEDPPICNASELSTECDTLSCGGLTACGACADAQCCDQLSGSCQDPQSVEDLPTSCDGSDELCAPAGNICVMDTCVAPAAEGDTCDPGCDPGETWCMADICVGTLADGEVCTAPEQCASLHCGADPANPFGDSICRPPVDVGESCGDTLAVCPTGTFCSGQCTTQKGVGESCGGNPECLSGVCGSNPAFDTDVCLASGICHLTWSDALP